LFVTSADRPFTESERAFLESIRQWGKKVDVVINKDDVLDGEAARREVETYVRSQVLRLLDFEPDLFLVSARAGLRAPDSPAANGFRRFRDYLRDTLTQAQRVALKLRSPLGVAAKLAADYRTTSDGRLQILEEDAQALRLTEKQWEAYEAEMRSEFEGHRARIENDLLQMSLRGEAFLDNHLRLVKIGEMLQGRRMRADFEKEVVADTPEKVGARVQEVIHRRLQDYGGVYTMAISGAKEVGLGVEDARLVRVAAPEAGVAPPVDTVGAGDAFDAGFLAGWLDGMPFERGLALAVSCGTLSTHGRGGTGAQPTMEQALAEVGSP